MNCIASVCKRCGADVYGGDERNDGLCPMCHSGYEKDRRIAVLETQLAAAERERDEAREYIRADAYCPCCGDCGPEHADGCDYVDERMDRARAALAAQKEQQKGEKS